MVWCKCCQGYATLCRVFTHCFFIAAVVLSCFAIGSCEFVTRDGLTIGLFRFSRDGSECMGYSDVNEFETGWLHDWSRVSGLIAVLFGALVVVLMLVDCCCNVCCSKYMQTFLVVCCQLNQGFTFLICKRPTWLIESETWAAVKLPINMPIALFALSTTTISLTFYRGIWCVFH